MRSRAQKYTTTARIFVVAAAVLVIQRSVYKLWARIDRTVDDWCTLVTLVFGIPGAIINAHFLPDNGIGRDIWTLTPDQITNFSRLFYFQGITYNAEVSLTKFALLFFYIRIFPSRNVRCLLWGTVIFNLLCGISFIIVVVFRCRPIHYVWVMWDKEHEGQCLNINTITWSNAILSIVLDARMLCIPLWQLRSLKLGWKKRLGVALMFCVGAV